MEISSGEEEALAPKPVRNVRFLRDRAGEGFERARVV